MLNSLRLLLLAVGAGEALALPPRAWRRSEPAQAASPAWAGWGRGQPLAARGGRGGQRVRRVVSDGVDVHFRYLCANRRVRVCDIGCEGTVWA